jgi:Cu-processing system permease protein
LLAALALSLTFLGSAPTGNVGVRALDVVIVSLSSLTIFLLPLIALLISHDAIVGEMERGTMLLLLSYPVARWQVLLGKFVGHLSILAFATLLGYGAAAGALAATGEAIDRESWTAFASMIGSSILLGAAFIAVGYLVSALVRERGTAAGIAVGIWLVFVLIYDMALLGLLVVDQGQVLSGGLLNALLLLNPTDAYRLFNLTGSGNVSAFSGMAGVAQTTTLGPSILLAALAAWALLPLGLAALAFSRREL